MSSAASRPVPMVKFVESDATGLPLKRKQVAQACLSCRRRKKRCVHEAGQTTPEDNTSTASKQNSVSPIQTGQNTISRSSSTAKAPSIEGRPLESPRESRATRFIGDLAPEHLLVEAISPHSSRDLSNRGGIGVWQGRHVQDVTSPPNLAPPRPGSIPTLQQVLAQHVQARCLTCIPPAADWHALRKIYFEKLEPLFPAIGNSLTDLPETSVAGTLIKQVICIAAAADPSALSHFRLRPSSSRLTRQEFTSSLSAAVQATIESGLLEDRVLLIRILLLFSMYMQPTNPEEADVPALSHVKAVCHMNTLGLHMLADKSNSDYNQTRALFLCIWVLDHLQAALYGRAMMIHERDVGWEIDELISEQAPPFKLFLMITRLLDNTMQLYRPHQRIVDEPLYVDLPILEQMILDAGASKLPSPLLSTLEIFYHSVSILSCRYPPGGSPSALPSRATNSRRSLSADRITGMVRDEYPGQLSYMPIIPYAVSLSLSVAYRKMRYSNVPMFKIRGRRAFAENAALLKDLGDAFWTAKTTAAMAEQVLQEMDKVLSSINAEQNQGVRQHDGSDGNTNLQRQDGNARGVRPTDQPQTPQNAAVRAGSMLPPDSSGNYDPSLLESAPEVDVFGHFDPAFNLGAVDAAIQGNLDFGTSFNWYDWQQTWSMMDPQPQAPPPPQ